MGWDCALKLSVEIVCADMDMLLKCMYTQNCVIFDVRFPDPITVRFLIGKKDFRKLRPMLDKKHLQYSVLRKTANLYPGKFWHRPVYAIGTLLLLVMTILLPMRILFINVEGNYTVPTNLILEKAEQCGVGFWCERSKIRSEAVKNFLLEEIPGLQWIGVNTQGCVATITVREKTQDKTETKNPDTVSSIIAARDGRIINCTVFRGSAQCIPGQTVSAGQLLVSGYTDCGIYLQATTAEADVLAQTIRELSVISPLFQYAIGEKMAVETNYSLRIGKKLIKISKDSGIPDATCVKIQKETILRLPGGFHLPVAWIREQYTSSALQIIKSENTDRISQYAKTYLTTQMVAGRIITSEESLAVTEDCILLSGSYSCTEMIGKPKYEEIVTAYGYDGTQR